MRAAIESRRWPRGVADCIRDIERGLPVNVVARRHRWLPRRLIRSLVLRIQWRRMMTDRTGGVAILTAIALPGILGAVALGVAMPVAISARQIAQGCADSAALAGAGALQVGNADPGAIAQAYATANGCPGADIDIDGDAVTVQVSSASTALGISIPVSASAQAAVNPVRLLR